MPSTVGLFSGFGFIIHVINLLSSGDKPETFTITFTNRTYLRYLKLVDFYGGRNKEEPGEKPSWQRREPTSNSTHMYPTCTVHVVPRIKPQPVAQQ
jgi:hypothetical protein